MTKPALTTALVLFALVGCKPRPSGPDWVSELRPDTPPPPRADLLLAGTRIPVDVNTVRRAKEYVIELSTFGETIEVEKYISTPTEFLLREALGEVFKPALTLLRSGAKLKEKWEWRGAISSGGVDRRATASVFMSDEPASTKALPAESIKVVVSLTIASGDGISAERGLAFYFVRQKGLLRRDFGHGSTRVPAGVPQGQN